MGNNNSRGIQSGNEAAAPPSPSQVLKVFPWERLPFEIRDKIFDNLEDESRYGLYFKWNRFLGSVPALVVALRSLPLSYEHVLQRFANCSSAIQINETTNCDLSDMSLKEVDFVEKIEMELSFIFHWVRACGPYGPRAFLENPRWSEQFLRATNLREVYLSINLDNNAEEKYFITEFPYWLEGCKALSKLTVEIPIGNVKKSDRRKALDVLMTRIRNKTGVTGQFIEVVGQKWYEKAEVWIWEAAPGTYMNWAQNLAMEWHDRVYYRRSLRYKRWSISMINPMNSWCFGMGNLWWRLTGSVLRCKMKH